jgi:hypothetical protein
MPNLHTIQTDAGPQFTSTEFINRCLSNNLNVKIAPIHSQDLKGITESTWKSIKTLAFAFLNEGRVTLCTHSCMSGT